MLTKVRGNKFDGSAIQHPVEGFSSTKDWTKTMAFLPSEAPQDWGAFDGFVRRGVGCKITSVDEVKEAKSKGLVVIRRIGHASPFEGMSFNAIEVL
jgi:hypothetical protein